MWPTILGVEPEDGEDPEAFAERICATEMASNCKHVVPRYRALILSAAVWRELEDRAREAISDCRTCRDDATYADSLEKLDAREKEIGARAALAEDIAHPKSWATAGDHAAPWSEPLLLTVERGGTITLGGEPVATGGLRKALLAAAKERAAPSKSSQLVLGVYLRPSARVSDVRAIITDAAAAMFSHIALQVRAAAYPYPLREYRLATQKRRGSGKVRVRDVDTVQILVQALDVTAAGDRAGAPSI